jgi:hypothetical protein
VQSVVVPVTLELLPLLPLWKQLAETIKESDCFLGRKLLNLLARLEGFEPPTLRSEVPSDPY